VDTPLLTTKLYVPHARTGLVLRQRLVEKLNAGMNCRLTLVSAPAGFGKTTLVSEWVAGCDRPVAWLSLDEADNDPVRFISYLISALQTIKVDIGGGLLTALQSPQPPKTELILLNLLNEITSVPEHFILILDDYHLIDSKSVDQSLAFLVEHQPPQMHLVITTREDPSLPLARLRVRGQLSELRASDLRFTPAEAAEFLNQAMGFHLSTEDIDALENRTEGWIAGLQLAALSMQGNKNPAGFIESFTGSHHFVLDYLLEEVLRKQSAGVQSFLLRTSILDRMCGSLCDAILLDPSTPGQETLEYLEHNNLFIVPLDNERHWYRYHHLFRDSLRQRLNQNLTSSSGGKVKGLAELHKLASQWFEDNGLEIEAFQHAAATNDVERAELLIDEKGLFMHFHGVAAILDWLALLPAMLLNTNPSLLVKYARALLISGQTTGVEEKLQAAEAALQGAGQDDKTRDLIGQIAANRVTLALSQYQMDTGIAQARRALEYLHSDNLSSRFQANWAVAFAYQFRGERAAARQAYTDALSIAQATGNIRNIGLITICLGQLQETENQLSPAAETYRRSLQLLSNQPPPSASDAYLGLARIFYEWNDMDAAERYGQQSLQLARQFDKTLDRFVICEVFLARLKLARGDVSGAAAMLAETEQSVRRNNFIYRIPEVAAAQVLILLHQGNLAAATHLAQTHDLPISQARMLLAQGDPSAALALLARFRQQMEAKGWADERLKTIVLQAIALSAHGEKVKARQFLGDALTLAEPGGFIRLFVDEGPLMAQLLSEAVAHGIMPDYVGKLLAVFKAEEQKSKEKTFRPAVLPFDEPLSQRELEILQLIAQGLSNREISHRLFLALDTVKGHNRIIFGKLQVQRRTEAVARARELGLL
jgi:LuxR family transcriptional regulator, maltose regulon positive regulatory protein